MTQDLTPSREIMEDLVSLFGLGFGGDIGDWTCYQNKNGKPVFYPRAVPEKPPSKPQQRQRMRFRKAQQNWMKQTSTVRQAWENLCRRCSLPCTGQNLWIKLSLTERAESLVSAIRESGITVTYPPRILE